MRVVLVNVDVNVDPTDHQNPTPHHPAITVSAADPTLVVDVVVVATDASL